MEIKKIFNVFRKDQGHEALPEESSDVSGVQEQPEPEQNDSGQEQNDSGQEQNDSGQEQNEKKVSTEQEISTAGAVFGGNIAMNLESRQYSKFHTRGGHGFAAEDANAMADRFAGRKVDDVGKMNLKNGADRISDGISIQTKYCADPASTVRAAFGKDGNFRYSGQILEVPKDQYSECLALMRKRIEEGKVPGVSDPGEAENLIKAGEITYKQAKNIARAGTVESLKFDLKSNAVTSSYIFAISFAVNFATRIWKGKTAKEAASESVKNSLTIGGSSLLIGVAVAQVLRTRLASYGTLFFRRFLKIANKTALGKFSIKKIAQVSTGKALKGAAAINNVSRLARSNVLSGIVTTTISMTPDMYRVLVSKKISWMQFAKNLSLNISEVAGGAAGWFGGTATGATIGSVAGPVGTLVGGVIGGIAGSVGGSYCASTAAKKITEKVIDDDKKRMFVFIQDQTSELAFDWMLTEEEIALLNDRLDKTLNDKFFEKMISSGGTDEKRKEYSYQMIDQMCLDICSQREKVALPDPELIMEEASLEMEELESETDYNECSDSERVVIN